MLKINLIRCVLKSILTTIVIGNLTLKLAAHDHPAAEYENYPLNQSCFHDPDHLEPHNRLIGSSDDSNNNSIAKALAASADLELATPPRHSIASSYLFMRSAMDRCLHFAEDAQFADAALRVAEFVARELQAPSHLIVRTPDEGTPPIPMLPAGFSNQRESQVASRVGKRGRLRETYLPYDLCVRDWEFRRNLDIEVVVPYEIESPSVPSKDFTGGIYDQRIAREEAQCKLSAYVFFARNQWDVFWDQRNAIANKVLVEKQRFEALLRKGFLSFGKLFRQQPFYSHPAFVIVELEDETKLVMFSPEIQDSAKQFQLQVRRNWDSITRVGRAWAAQFEKQRIAWAGDLTSSDASTTKR
ncbi:MAG: hypothetical protein AAF483_28760 [Planctomycetota bacterium]